jgi:ABC-type transport system substrate-binding protein
MHSQGKFSHLQSYTDPEVDAMIEAAVTETDDNKRIEIYWKLCNKYFEDCIGLPLVQPYARHWQRDWVEGWYYNPLHPQTIPGDGGHYYYHLWKGYAADVNFDYWVNLFDLTIIGFAWDATPASGNWAPCADTDNDGHIFLYDLTIVGTYYD